MKDGYARPKRGGAQGKQAAMGGVLGHDNTGSQVDWPSKNCPSGKVNHNDGSKIKRHTFVKVMSAKKEPVKTINDRNASTIF